MRGPLNTQYIVACAAQISAACFSSSGSFPIARAVTFYDVGRSVGYCSNLPKQEHLHSCPASRREQQMNIQRHSVNDCTARAICSPSSSMRLSQIAKRDDWQLCQPILPGAVFEEYQLPATHIFTQDLTCSLVSRSLRLTAESVIPVLGKVYFKLLQGGAAGVHCRF